MPVRDEKLEALLQDLPDRKGARLFLDRLSKDHPRVLRKLLQEPGLLSDVLALAAWSPLLGTTLEQSPDYVLWLNRERLNPRVRTPDELKESLARFALTHSSLNPQVLLARFRRHAETWATTRPIPSAGRRDLKSVTETLNKCGIALVLG